MAAVFGVADLERVLALARRFPIFPCAQTKRPLVSSGFHAATQDSAQIRAWWRQWPDALVGVPTGQGTQLVVVDYDPDKATQATHSWIAEHTDLLCSTRAHKTGRGGMHYLFKSADRYQTGVDLVLDGSPRKGIDLRANGGYIIWWPLHGGDVVGESIAPVPADLIDERRFQEKRDFAPLPTATPATWRAERDRAEAALTHLAPDGYEFWIRVGMALHHASGGSDEGFAVWHEWSARGDSYDGIEDCRYHWNSFGGYSGRAIGLGTIYAAAKAAGFSSARSPQDGVPDESYANDPEAQAELAQRRAAELPDVHPALVLRPLHEIVAEQREPEWLIEDVIEANVLAVLAGPRSTFKSFVALDWAMRVALGGLPVVILSGEGAGLDRRADAWMKTHAMDRSIASMPVFALERALNLNQDTDMVLLRAAVDRLDQAPSMIVIDTFSKFSAGLDENDNGEVSTYLARLSEHIRQAFGSTVLLVAHSGHGDSARPRGASALMANPDAEYIIARPSPTAMAITVSRERFKDCPALAPLGYEAQVIDLGRLDKRGKVVTSLALVTSDVVMPAPKREGGRNQERALVALREYHRANPESRFLTSMELAGMLAAQGLKDRRRRPEVIAWLVAAGILTNSIGGHVLDPTNL